MVRAGQSRRAPRGGGGSGGGSARPRRRGTTRLGAAGELPCSAVYSSRRLLPRVRPTPASAFPHVFPCLIFFPPCQPSCKLLGNDPSWESVAALRPRTADRAASLPVPCGAPPRAPGPRGRAHPEPHQAGRQEGCSSCAPFICLPPSRFRARDGGSTGTAPQPAPGAARCPSRPVSLPAGAGAGGTSELGSAHPSGWHREARRPLPRPALPPCGRPLLARTGRGGAAPDPCYPSPGGGSAGAARGTGASVPPPPASLPLLGREKNSPAALRPAAWPNGPDAGGGHAGPAAVMPGRLSPHPPPGMLPGPAAPHKPRRKYRP